MQDAVLPAKLPLEEGFFALAESGTANETKPQDQQHQEIFRCWLHSLAQQLSLFPALLLPCSDSPT